MMIELLVLVVIVAALSLAVYHIAQFSTKEMPFEEALAEQRQKRSLDIVPMKTEKIMKKAKIGRRSTIERKGQLTERTKGQLTSQLIKKKAKDKELKRVKPKKDEIGVLSKDNIVPVHRPTTTKTKDATMPAQGTQVKDKNASESILQKRGVAPGSLQSPHRSKPPLNVNSEKKEKKGEKCDEKEEKKVKKEETKSKTNNEEEESKKLKKEEKAKKEVVNEEKKGIKERMNKQELKEGKEKIKMEDKEERKDKKEEAKGEKKCKEERKKQEDKKMRREEAKEEDQRKRGNRSPLGSVPHLARAAERTNNKKITEPAARKNSLSGGSTPKTAPSPKKAAHSAKEAKQKNNEESQKMEKAKVVESAPRVPESAAKTQSHESAPVGGSPSQSSDRKKRKEKEREQRKRMISLSDDVVSRLMPIIQRAQLSGGEVQTLIEALLNKQLLSGGAGGGGEWVAKGRVDPEIQLRRQLEDVESRLREQTDAHETLSAKIVDLRSELNSERGRNSLLKKKLESTDTLCQQRLDATATTHKEQLTAKLAELRASLTQEYQSKLVQHQQSTATEHEGKLKEMRTSISEMEAQLQNAKDVQQESEAESQHVQTALAEAEQQLQATSHEREELMARCQQYQQHLASVKEQSDQHDAALNSRLYEVQQKVSAAETAHSQVVMQLTQSAKEIEVLQQQLGNLEGVREMLTQSQATVNNLTFEKGDIENRLLQIERSKTDLEKRLHQTQKEKKRSESRLQQNEKDRKELDIRLAQVEKEVARFTELIRSQRAEIECLKEEKESLAAQSVRPAAEGRENGDVHDNRREPRNFEHIPEEQISGFTKEISRLKEESLHLRKKSEKEKLELERSMKMVLLRIYPSLKSVEHFEPEAFLAEVETASAALKTQLSPVIEKIVEKVVPDPKLCQQIDQLKKENADLNEKMEDLRAEKCVLESRVEELSEEKASLENSVKSSLKDENDRKKLVCQLELENKGLTEKVTNYQDILANTESLLKTLQKSVESEELTWREKLVQKEELVRQLTADKKNLALQVSELQSSLDKVKQAEEMESQLNCLKEKLTREEEAKELIQEQLNKAQEQIKAANSLQVSTNGPANGIDGHEVGISVLSE